MLRQPDRFQGLSTHPACNITLAWFQAFQKPGVIPPVDFRYSFSLRGGHRIPIVEAVYIRTEYDPRSSHLLTEEGGNSIRRHNTEPSYLLACYVIMTERTQ